MAYTQVPGGIRPGVFAEIEKVAKFVKEGGKLGDKKQVQSYDVSTGKHSNITVSKNSASDKAAEEFGNVVNFGESVSQKKSSTTGKLREGTNTNVMASASTYGKLPKGFKGMAYDKSNKKVDFSTNNQDKRRGEKFRIYK